MATSPTKYHQYLTKSDPLVAKYYKYLHGGSEGDCRAVLDSKRLPRMLETQKYTGCA